MTLLQELKHHPLRVHKNYTHGNLIASKCTKFGNSENGTLVGTPLVCNIVYFDYATLCKKVL